MFSWVSYAYTNLLVFVRAEYSEVNACVTDTEIEHNDLKGYLMQITT